MKKHIAGLIFNFCFLLPFLAAAQDITVETPAIFPGCEQIASNEELPTCFNQKINQFINENIRYPLEAVESEIQGKVYVQFVIDANGDVSKIEVVRGVHETLDDEAKRVISLLPKCKPATRNGNPISQYFRVPVNFVLI